MKTFKYHSVEIPLPTPEQMDEAIQAAIEASGKNVTNVNCSQIRRKTDDPDSLLIVMTYQE